MSITSILEKICGAIWGNGLIFLLLSAGILYTVKLRFIQFRFIPFLIHSSKNDNKSDQNGISQLRTVCMSLGTAMGTGNITGVASAIAIGGAGAVFWMWISAFLGMSLVYAENYLSATFSKNSPCKGPMAYIEHGMGYKRLAVIFAFFCTAASIGMGGMVQVNSFAVNLSQCIEINPVLLFFVILAVIIAVVKGGAERISSTAQLLLPVVTVSYIIVSAAVILRFRYNIIPAFESIFTEAFNFGSAAGGITGFAVSKAVSAGIRRGIFSNEAGLGSSPILHSASENTSPQVQGMWSMFEVFFDTIICCTVTALTLLTASEGKSVTIADAFSHILGNGTNTFLTVSMGIFAFCTIIGWYFCGETSFSYIFGSKNCGLFTFLFSLLAASGALFSLHSVWLLSDIFNGLMAFCNLLALFLLIKHVHKE